MKLKIKHKLFFTLLLTSIVVASGMFFFMQWSFDRGFLNYVNSQELEELDQLSERLTSLYAENGSWQFLQKNPVLWRQLHGNSVAADERQPPGQLDRNRFQPRLPPPERRDQHRPPPRRGNFAGGDDEMIIPPPPANGPLGFGPRIVLFDTDKQKVIGGPPEEDHELNLRPFIYQSQVIGYLGLIPRKELSDEGDLLFVEQQTESFALVALAMVALSLLLSFPVTSHLLRPIKQLTAGTRKLIAGKFGTRIPLTSKDELGQLSEDFNSLAITLEKNEKARQQWVADISHELRTPLAVLRGEIEALQDGIRQPSAQNLETLHAETLHLGRLVNDLYELSMSDIGALSYKKIKVDPVGILEGTVELFEQRFAQKGLKLIANLPANSAVALLADPDRLQQLFTNLLENSLRYTDSPGLLEIRMEGSKNSVAFHFQDSSPGVQPSQLSKLFDRLYRVEESRNRAKGGAGLGMAICKNIVEAHRGKIDASHSPHGGLWIKVELPLGP